MNNLHEAGRSVLRSLIPLVFFATALPFVHAQDPGAQAAQQAAQQATEAAAQQSMQATQQAAQDAQQAAQQAMQQSMQNSGASSSVHVRPHQPPSSGIPTGPVPPQIAAAKTVFLINAGADPNFPDDGSKSYSHIYAALQAWGHYQLVDSPAKADLLFRLRDIAPVTGVSGDENNVYSIDSPTFKLTIIDAKTNVPIWTVNSPVIVAGRGRSREGWFELSVTNLVSRVKVLANVPLTEAESNDLTTYPKSHAGVAAGLLIGGMLAVGIGGGFLLHHEFENSLAQQKADQDKFCEANHIPLNMCAGG